MLVKCIRKHYKYFFFLNFNFQVIIVIGKHRFFFFFVSTLYPTHLLKSPINFSSVCVAALEFSAQANMSSTNQGMSTW